MSKKVLDLEISTPRNPDKLWTNTWQEIERNLREEVRSACLMGKVSARLILIVRDKDDLARKP